MKQILRGYTTCNEWIESNFNCHCNLTLIYTAIKQYWQANYYWNNWSFFVFNLYSIGKLNLPCLLTKMTIDTPNKIETNEGKNYFPINIYIYIT